ncbi:hypothetical protein GCM10010862_08770 [Devosia nitrariae]|uniref:Uncharacterized protein n=2 Tax=Devosia nitrariae TaxID=2071872 RepID=A0ABQ5W1L2_9HYPH|nr:hypothetical protein GCM10010862_08770 [Devosia nitrariae]
MRITSEIINATPVSKLRGVEWFETGDGYFARVTDDLGRREFHLQVKPTAYGWIFELSQAEHTAKMILELDVKNDTEARMAAVDRARTMAFPLEDCFDARS